MNALFSPYLLRDLKLANRIVVSPMCQYSAENGAANEWHMIHIGGLALSGAGMLTIEATAVEPTGRITPGCLGLWDDGTEEALVPIFRAIRRHSKIAVTIQLAHAGRKASSEVPWKGGASIPVELGGWIPDAPSAVPHGKGEPTPTALDRAGLERIRDAFVAATRRALRLGVAGIELHAAHGYLLHEFLSPIANHRTDAFGGALENRLRFPLEVVDAVRAALPASMPLGVKVSATDWVDGGWDLEQTIAFARELKRRSVDWISVSSGGISPAQKIPVGPGYQVPFAAAIRKATGLTVTAVGLITGAKQANEVVTNEMADLVALARSMLYDPRWPWHAAAQLGGTVDAPPQYWRAPPHGLQTLFGATEYGAR